MVTILELAKYRGLQVSEDESFSMGDINAVGLEIMGGCEICQASIACYNAYPSRSGYWRCEDCIGDEGYETVETASAAIFEDAPKPQEVTALNAKQDQGEDRLPFDFVTSDPEPGVTRFLVVDSEGNEIAQCISEDWAIKTAEALRKYTA